VVHSCEWKALTERRPKPLPKHIPQHLRKKMRAKPPPSVFEVKPPGGSLEPGETNNVWIRFVPSEEVSVEAVQGHWRGGLAGRGRGDPSFCAVICMASFII